MSFLTKVFKNFFHDRGSEAGFSDLRLNSGALQKGSLRTQLTFEPSEHSQANFEKRELYTEKLKEDFSEIKALLEQNNQTIKYSRNAPCVCGSGKKYKKCCLNNIFSSRKEDIRVQNSMHKMREKLQDDGSIVIDTEKLGLRKMSEIILEYANELMIEAHSDEDKKKSIMIAIAAWNLSFLGEEQRKEQMQNLLCSMNLSENSEIDTLLQTLINKKHQQYKSIDRYIVSYEFLNLGSDDYHLNIASIPYKGSAR